jgi:ABC-type cobalamin/Fe3+-siderophores transport system ATPase subunit
MIIFRSLKYKNLLSTGNQFTEIDLIKSNNTCILGSNGSGKCFDINTMIKVRNKITKEIIELTVGEFYELQKRQKH